MTRIGLSRDQVTAIFLLFGLLAYGGYALTMRRTLAQDVMGPHLYPLVLCIIGITLATILFFKGATTKQQPDDNNAASDSILLDHNAVLSWVMIFAYFVLTVLFGFLISTVIFLSLMSRWLGLKSILSIGLFVVLFISSVYMIFSGLIGMNLPSGYFINILG